MRTGRAVPADVAWPVGLILVAIVSLLAAAIIVDRQQLADQADAIAEACGGVVARLDLTEWIELCRTG
jgi:hypothetical protein